MAWGAAYETPEELAEKRAQQDAALEAQQRAKLSQFERRAIDVLTDIAGSLKRLADNMQPIYTLDAETGEVTVQHGNPDEVTQLRADVAEMRRALFGGFGETSGSEGDVGTASAGPVTDPGPARPDTYRCSANGMPRASGRFTPRLLTRTPALPHNRTGAGSPRQLTKGHMNCLQSPA